jgi:signal transduction histidine kinase
MGEQGAQRRSGRGADRGLTRRLGRELLLQALYISVAVGLGVFVAATLIKDVLIKQALEGEAAYYWQRQAEAEAPLTLPDTRNMTGFRAGQGAGVPPELRGLEPGFHELDRDENGDREHLAFVSEQSGERLYLVFDVEQVDELVTLFGLAPLTVALIVVYLSLYGAYRISRRAVSPLVQLADKVQAIDPTAPDPSLFSAEQLRTEDDEIRVLSEALLDLTRRVKDFAEREQRFTRDASHELRTPLTVIRMATDRVRRDEGLSEDSSESLQRIRKSVDDMERLTAAFLLLARESRESLEKEWVSVNEVAAAELERMRIVYPDGNIEGRLEAEGVLMVLAPEKVVETVIGNLLRNAFAYTDRGSVTVRVGRRRVAITDTGRGMDPDFLENAFRPWFRDQRQRGGFGVGLTIVKRMADRFGWRLDISSEVGEGTCVTVEFPESRYIA